MAMLGVSLALVVPTPSGASPSATIYLAFGINEPQGITTGPDGNLWFANADNNSIGRMTPAGDMFPNHGPAAGGTAVTITGTGFTSAYFVRFGTTSASFSVVNSTTINAFAPAHAPGLVNIFVSNWNGTSAAVPADIYAYQ